MLGTQPRLCVGGPDARPHPARARIASHAGAQLEPPLCAGAHAGPAAGRGRRAGRHVGPGLDRRGPVRAVRRVGHEHHQRGLHTGPGNPRHHPGLQRHQAQHCADAFRQVPGCTACDVHPACQPGHAAVRVLPADHHHAAGGPALGLPGAGRLHEAVDRPPERLGTDLGPLEDRPLDRGVLPLRPRRVQDQRRHRAAAGARLPCLHRGQWQPERAVVQLYGHRTGPPGGRGARGGLPLCAGAHHCHGPHAQHGAGAGARGQHG